MPPDKQREAGLSRYDEAQAKTSKEEEEEGPQRATETSVGVCTLLQRYPGSHQGPEPQRHLWGCLQDRGLHVGQSRRGTETGTNHGGVKYMNNTVETNRNLYMQESFLSIYYKLEQINHSYSHM